MLKINKLTATLKNFLGGKKNETPQQESHPERSYEGEVCRVLNDKNACFFVGKIEEYDEAKKEVKISAYRSDSIPSRTHFNDYVKLYIQNSNHVTTMYGTVTRQSSDFWWVTVSEIVQHSNQREGFRQIVHGSAIVTQKTAVGTLEIPCELIDISLSGVCISCDQELQKDEKILLSGVSLYTNAPRLYNFDCMICRSFQDEDEVADAENVEGSEETEKQENTEKNEEDLSAVVPSKYYYGCIFLQLSAADRSDLHQDIFFLQKQERQSELW